MNFAMQSLHKMSFVQEPEFGIQPAPSNHKSLRHSGCELSFSRKSIESDEISDNRQIPAFISGVGKVEGDIDFEFSYGAYDEFLEGALGGSWNSNVLKTGANFKSFAIEREFQDIGEYQVYSGCVIDQMSLNIRPDSIVGGRFSILGKNMTRADATTATTVQASDASAPMDSFQAEISENGTRIAHVVGVEMTLSNSAEEHFIIGADTPEDVSLGKSRIKGELSAYFENGTLVQRFLEREKSSLAITVKGDSGEYDLLLPNIRYTGLEMPVKGEQAVILTLPFVALFDEIENTNFKITRTSE